MDDKITLQVAAEESGERLDVYLTRHFPKYSRSQLKLWIQAGAVRVNGVVTKAGHRLTADEEISVRTPRPQPSRLQPEPLTIEVLYEDRWLVAVNKPAGMVVHPGAGNPSGTLANALLHRFQSMSQLDPVRPGIVHRLDKDTSGVLVAAKDQQTQELLAAQFRRREVDKRYLALVFGQLREKTGMIDLPIGRHPRVRTRISPYSHKLRPAQTSYRVIRWFEEFSLLELMLHTGRTHQIRVHLEHLKHPVVGDRAYAAGYLNQVKDSRAKSWIRRLDRHFLHAWKLSFLHPFSGEQLHFKAPLPRPLCVLLHGISQLSRG